MSIFCDSLYTVFLFNAVLGLDFLGLALSRPQVGPAEGDDEAYRPIAVALGMRSPVPCCTASAGLHLRLGGHREQ
jgi:hypothetical protein